MEGEDTLGVVAEPEGASPVDTMQISDDDIDGAVGKTRSLHMSVTGRLTLTAEQRESARANKVVLRVQQTGNTEAKILEMIYWVCMLLVIGYGIATLAISAQGYGSAKAVPKHSWFVAQLAVVAAFLAGVIGFVTMYWIRFIGVRRKGKFWMSRQKMMAVHATVLSTLCVLDLSTLVASYALVLATPCVINETAINTLGLLRAIFLTSVLLWLTIMARLMLVHRGKAKVALAEESPQDPDRILLIDQPVKVIIKSQWFFILIFVVLILAIFFAFLGRLSFGAESILPPLSPSCPQNVPVDKICSATLEDFISYAFMAVIIIAYFALHTISLRRAWKDQRDLPTSHFKLSKIFVRIQMRYERLFFFSVFFGGVVVDLASIGTCNGVLNSQLGSTSAHISIAVYAIILQLLYMPARADDTFTQEIFQTLAWTEDDIEDEVEARKSKIDFEQSLQTKLASYIAKQIGVPDTFGVLQSPMESVCCMEYLIKLFYWSRASYKDIHKKKLPEIPPGSKRAYTREIALKLFGMNEFFSFHEKTTDSLAIMGTGNDTCVISFRGTASSVNIMTDLKAWSTSYAPHPFLSSDDTFHGEGSQMGTKVFSVRVNVHAGFYAAWTGKGFNERVINAAVDQVKKMESLSSRPTKVFVTGHSLGGALATLCALELKLALKDNRIHVYTFGAPRVGNTAFSTLANSLIPDFWHIVRTEDPVARIPKGFSYRRSGQRIILGSKGNMTVHPSHFEVALFSAVGGRVSDHRLMMYGLSLGEFLKAQFIPSLSLLDAAPRVAKLAKKIDLEETLLVEQLNGDALKDKNLTLSPVANAEKAKKKRDGNEGAYQCCDPVTSCFCMPGCGKKPEAKSDDGDMSVDAYSAEEERDISETSSDSQIGHIMIDVEDFETSTNKE